MMTFADVSLFHLDNETVSPGPTDFPVYGYPGFAFYFLHIAALSSLVTSILCSCVTLALNFCRCSSLVFFNSEVAKVNFWKRQIASRLIVYLAVADLCFSFSHLMDHGSMLYLRDNPPDAPCAAFSFVVLAFLFSQGLIITFSAFNAAWLVVKRRKINLGCMDWRFITYAYGFPLCISIIGVSVGYLGPTGMW